MADGYSEQLIQSQVGNPGFKSVGSLVTRPRAGASGEWVLGAAHAPHFEAASRGNVYSACNAAAITFGTALTATGVTFHLSNPINSKVDLVILHAAVNIITATTSGTIVLATSYSSVTAPATNTAITVVGGKGINGGGVGQAYSVSTLPVAPTAHRVLGGCVATVANVPAIIRDDINGAIVLGPGTQLSIQGITIVGTGICSMTWEEVPNQ